MATVHFVCALTIVLSNVYPFPYEICLIIMLNISVGVRVIGVMGGYMQSGNFTHNWFKQCLSLLQVNMVSAYVLTTFSSNCI